MPGGGLMGARSSWVAATVLALAASAGATTFTVGSTALGPDWATGDGICETAPGSGVCTFVAALEEAGAFPNADVIVLPAGTYAVPPVRLETDVIISGAGADRTIIASTGSD